MAKSCAWLLTRLSARMPEDWAQEDALRSNCAADVERLCPYVPSGQNKLYQCLRCGRGCRQLRMRGSAVHPGRVLGSGVCISCVFCAECTNSHRRYVPALLLMTPSCSQGLEDSNLCCACSQHEGTPQCQCTLPPAGGHTEIGQMDGAAGAQVLDHTLALASSKASL